MTDEHLIKYIKNQISKGFTKDQIKNAALQTGWPNSIVDDAIKKATQKSKKKRSNLIFIIPLIALILIGSVLGYLIYFDDIFNNIEEQNQEINNNQNNNELIEENSINECFDIECFINYTQNCEKVKMNLTEEIIDDFTIINNMYYELIGEEDNKCLLYFKNNEMDLIFDENASDEEINFINSMMPKGFEGTCKYSKEKFNNIIQDLKLGEHLSFYIEEPECNSTIDEINVNDTINLSEVNIQMVSLRKGTTINHQELSFMYKENTNEGYLIEFKIDNCFEEILLIDEFEFKCENRYKKIKLNKDLSNDEMLTVNLIPST